MTCSTCHNTHQNQRGDLELFSQKCVSCHTLNTENFNAPGHTGIRNIETNCIDCHMPAQPSKSIAVFLQGEETPRASLLRSHYIGIYADEVTKFSNKNK
ncbi:MAG: hypothetical protein EPN92_07240 [Chitinophagaceae bacterium]|nr:MAG: hypothetical protein EPN92_07240 [Chitinophagaceae bacterium]